MIVIVVFALGVAPAGIRPAGNRYRPDHFLFKPP